MKAEQRHDLHRNALADWLENTGQQLQPYSRAIVGVLIAAVIVVGVYVYLNSLERRNAEAASDQLIYALLGGGPQDLQAAVEDHRGTQPSTLAQLHIAELLLGTGTNALYSNKPAGREYIFRAAENFAAVERESRDPMIKAWALYGLARAHESMGDLDRARNEYQELRRQYPESSLNDTVRNHMARLDQQSVKEFYDWFAKQDPRPPISNPQTGTPGVKPAFDTSEPTASPNDVKLPSALGGSGEPSPQSSAPSTTPAPDSSQTGPANK